MRSNAVLNKEYQKHINRTRAKMLQLGRGSKTWWALNRRLLNRKAKTFTIAPLKRGGVAIIVPKDKANLLAETFCTNCQLPPHHQDLQIDPAHAELETLPFVRSCLKRRILSQLELGSSTGPDGIPSRVLKHCKVELAFPVALIAARIWKDGRWPDQWRLHWVHPLFKKNAVSDPQNYKNTHLIHVLSKVVERIIASFTVTHLIATNALV